MKNHQYVFTINILCLLTLCFYSHNGFPQVFNADQYPPSVKWRQINTENFQVIYPSIFEAGAQRLANDLEILRERVSESLGVKPRKISIILQNQTVESNGNVQLAPRRSEFYTTPPQHSDFQDWLNNLAIHELRHVAQFDKLTGYLRAPFFEQLALAIYGANLPAWFFEGDAVLTETKLSLAGRGRLPSWEMPFRTNLLSGKKYSYQKDYLGSLKNITPGFYELGYFLTWQLEKAYGADILDSLITRIAKLPIRPYNFSSSLKKYTGYNTRQWHEKTREELTQRWEQQLIENAPEDYPVFPDKQAGKPASWLLPRRLADGRVMALHQDVHRVPAIVILDTAGRQDEVAKTGRQTDPHFSYASGKVVWDELRRDKRYGKRTYNVINLYDLEARSYRQLTRKSRYFSPALRPDAKQLIAVSVDEDNAISLVLLDTESGQRIARFPSPENIQLQTPAFDQTGTKVIVTGVSRQGAALIELDLPSGSYRMALPWQAQQIERPTYADNRIIFKAHYNGIDNLYALDTAANTIYQLTNARFGAFNPSVDTSSNRILFNNYQLDGYRISQVEPITSKYSDFKPLTQPNHTYTDNDTTYFEKWASKPYKGLKNIFNFHSLSVDNDNFDNLDDMKPGVYWLSDDLLNTTQLRLGYVYDGDIRSSEYLASVTYQRFFPKFSLEYLNRGQVGAARITSGGQEDVIGLRWRENTATLTMDIPFVFYQRNHVIASGFSTATSYTQRYNLNEPQFENRFIDRIQFPMHYQVYFNHSTRQSMLDLAPRWGQHLSITYRHFPFDNQVSGQLLSLRTAFYFPGLWRNHSLLARFNYQQRNGTYQMANDIPLVSGYDQLRPLPVDNTLLVSYRFPIAYPDWSIGPLAYIKRFKGGFFADFQNVRAGNAFQPRTFGIEFRSDMNLLRYYLPNFDIGIKLVYANEPNPRRRVFATYGIGYSY
ncbi:hypothetical protein SAMN05660226_01546 [Parapedobacter luteus]|uniref:WD40-like Beta Propeller Repeat n=1 Tax=Parapedobacter luteus TaxID=623280 RepID=A0A1T5BKZ9_9SPHI|nr:hypothetical protein SAMN05660226_01546 [Parapedobacter luteus]